MQKIQIRVFLSICALLFISMLLVNFVLVMLWQRDALQQEREKNTIILAGIQTLLPADYATLEKSSQAALSSGRRLSNPSSDHIQVFFDKKAMLPLSDDFLGRILNSMAMQAEKSGRSVSRYTGSLFSLTGRQNRLIADAEPIKRNGKTVGAVGIVRSLNPMFHKIWQAEKTTLVYILINLLILGVVAFFRMGKLIARPIDRLVRLADQYGDREEVLFALDKDTPGNEFGRLAHSLNSMLTRIEDDRRKMAQSVAELEEVNKELVATRQDIVRAEKLASVGRLAAGLAHEIGNPIGVVQGYLGLLRQQDLTPFEQEDFVRRSENELQRINKLVRQLLDFSRSNSGRRENILLHAVLQDLVEMMQSQPCMREIEIRVDYATARDDIRADPDQIRQVFFNCLLNAADAIAFSNNTEKIITITTTVVATEINQHGRTGSAGRNKHMKIPHSGMDRPIPRGDFRINQHGWTKISQVTAATKDENSIRHYSVGNFRINNNMQSNIEVRIADTGIGIAADDLDNIFDPFFTTKEPGKGTGLGLSVAYSIIEGCGGTMRLESQEGQGTTVFVELPLVHGKDSPDEERG